MYCKIIIIIIINIVTFEIVYEVAPIKWRAHILLFYQIFITLGILISFLFSFPILQSEDNTTTNEDSFDERWWSVVFAVPVITSSLFLLIFTYGYRFDSPIFYYNKHDTINVSYCFITWIF